jgi:hypothetical protein
MSTNSTELRAIWDSMISRCHNERHFAYKWYGARGIAVCERWRLSFDDFATDVGERPSPKHQLDRRDNDIGYSPENVRWATSKEQNNNRRDNRRIEAFGITLTMAEWSDETGINYNTLWSRYRRGWDFEEMLSKIADGNFRRCDRKHA